MDVNNENPLSRGRGVTLYKLINGEKSKVNIDGDQFSGLAQRETSGHRREGLKH